MKFFTISLFELAFFLSGKIIILIHLYPQDFLFPVHFSEVVGDNGISMECAEPKVSLGQAKISGNV